jgi:molybdopterin/thiamine biosynthesis adenylyltransferase
MDSTDLELLETALMEAHDDVPESATEVEEGEKEEEKIIIPEVSPTLLIDETSSRFSSAEWFEEIKKTSAVVAGVGGIGSYVAFLLSRTKIGSINLYDDDNVEMVNLAGQLYSKDDVGRNKVAAIGGKMARYSDYYNTNTFYKKFVMDTYDNSLIRICGFDNMAARRGFFINFVKRISESEHPEEYLFIDGRLDAENFQVFCFTGADKYLMEKYEREWLFDDTEAAPTICSMKQTSYCANMIASVIVNLVVNFIANKCNPLVPRELPFFTYYDAERMMFKTEL